MNEFETGVCVGILLQKRGGSANLDSVTFTENGTYTPTAPLDGWDEVTVQVKTWKDEYEQMKDCCDAVQDAIIDNWDPDDPDPPTKPIPPEDIPGLIEQMPGYTFPDGTEYPDIQPLVGGDDIIEDTSVDGYPYMYIVETQHNTWGMSCGYFSGGVFTGVIGWDFGIDIADEKPTVQSVKMIDSNTGYVEYTARYWLWGDYHTQTRYATISELIGYGESGHTYRVRN